MDNFQDLKNHLSDKDPKTTPWEEKTNCLVLKPLATQKLSKDLRME